MYTVKNKLCNASIYLTITVFAINGCSMVKEIFDDEPVEQFIQIQLTYGSKDELDTFAKTYKKDVFADTLFCIPFWFTNGEQKKIEMKTISTEYFSMPDTLKYEIIEVPFFGPKSL